MARSIVLSEQVSHIPGKMQSLIPTPSGEVTFLSATQRASYHKQYVGDLERCEYFVPIKWLETVSLAGAVKEIGLFGNQNTVCKPTASKWRATVDRLKQKFPNYDK